MKTETPNHTNLYDFLRRLRDDVSYDLTSADRDWVTAYLRDMDTEISFRGRKTGVVKLIDGVETPEIDYHLALAGEPVDVFTLLTEAMILNPVFASVVIAASRFYQEHVPSCPHCREHHDPAAEHIDVMQTRTWAFEPPKSDCP